MSPTQSDFPTNDSQELRRLRREVDELKEKVSDLKRRIGQFQLHIGVSKREIEIRSQEPPAAPPLVDVPPVIKDVEKKVVDDSMIPPLLSPQPTQSRPTLPKESFEVRLGTYWLPRIGIAVLLAGFVFLINWSYHYMGKGGKVALSYFCCIVLGGLGLWLEKRMEQFARVLQAGALALLYFVTYAAYAAENFKVIESTPLALCLLILVVTAIVVIADKRQSVTLAGMSLFLGYFTSIISGVATFTLISNAVLVLAALFFLSRNRWIHISFGAVLATYLAYALWVWKFSQWSMLDHLIFDSGYLSPNEFWLRAGFLLLYWTLFTAGTLVIKKEALTFSERNGLVILNSALFFVLFSLLMHHAYPEFQWRFHGFFAACLLALSSIAYQRFKPDRTMMDTLFVLGILVGTLGMIDYFSGVSLVAALSVESLILLLLAQAINLPWIAWIGRGAFTVAALYAWSRYPHWNSRMIFGVGFAAGIGLVCAKFQRKIVKVRSEVHLNAGSLLYAATSTILLITAAQVQFGEERLPWIGPTIAVLVGAIGAGLQTREILWMSNLPLLWSLLLFYGAFVSNDNWALDQSLFLIAITFGFGIITRGYRPIKSSEISEEPTTSGLLLLYSILAVGVMLATTMEYCPKGWLLTEFTLEGLVLIVAAAITREHIFARIAWIPIIFGVVKFIGLRRWYFQDQLGSGWINLLLGFFSLISCERVVRLQAEQFHFTEKARNNFSRWMVFVIWVIAINGTRKVLTGNQLTLGWGACGLVLLGLGFWLRQRSYRLAGFAALGFSLLRIVFFDLISLSEPYRILSFIGLGVIVIFLSFLYAKNREKLADWL